MWLKSINVTNYKGFKNCAVNLSSGMNIIVGRNNAGKTALLELLSLRFENRPHRDANENPKLPAGGSSEVKLVASMTGHDLLRYYALSGQVMYLTYDPRDTLALDANSYLEQIGGRHEIEYYAHRSESGFHYLEHPSVKLPFVKNGNTYAIYAYQFQREAQKFLYQANSTNVVDLQQAGLLGQIIKDIYFFKAERLNLSESASGANRTLAANSENLPEVLGKLQEDRLLFDKYVNDVNKILPNIRDVRVENMGGNRNKILITGSDPQQRRSHLYFELKECGTGIGQVLAIVYAVTSQEQPCVLIIDEPNSFLHPDATRNLIEFFNENPRHQYIISTHSTEVIAAAKKKQITISRWNGNECTVETHNPESVNAAQECLLEVGTRLSDVFGADKVCWVEGETERLAFPKILEVSCAEYKNAGIAFAAIRATGDLEGKTRQAFLDIYQRMSQGVAILPPTVHIIFDNETRSESERADLTRQSKGLLDFQPRRTYENYLLDSEAIASVIKKNAPDSTVTAEQVDVYILSKRGDAINYCGEAPDLSDQRWLYEVDGARLLDDLFWTLSNATIKFSKTKHSLELTEWLLQNRPEHFNELADFLKRVLFNPAAAQEKSA